MIRKFVVLHLLIFNLLASASDFTPIHHKKDKDYRHKAYSGRYFYVGEVPRLKPEDIELIASKMGLTLRVKAWININTMNLYRFQLFNRWWQIHQALNNPKISIHLSSLESIQADEEYEPYHLWWLKIIQQYMGHVLDPIIDKNEISKNDETFKLEISNRIKFFLLKGDDKNLGDPNRSRNLFFEHLKDNFTPSSERKGYLGYLTFVYPMAGGVDGPFQFPYQKFTSIKFSLSNDARWWSDKWGEDFGGFPFLFLHDGIGFHGPITRKSGLNTWFLQRGYVSHSCLRLDGSDIMELVQMYPQDFNKIRDYASKVTILDYFDVVDWNQDGTEEVINVDYYKIPFSTSNPDYYKIENQKILFWQNHSYASSYFSSEYMTMQNIPRYDLMGKKPIEIGIYKSVPLSFFKMRKSRLIQYFEEGIEKKQNSGDYNDDKGEFPPSYFREY